MNRRTKELLAENNALERGLNVENNKILTDIVVYLRTAPVSEYQQELVRRDITHMMLDGQARGASMQEVLGDDYQAFCDQVLAALPPMSMLSRVLTAAGNLCYYLTILTAIWLAFELVPNLLVRAGLYVRITVGDVLGGAAIVAAASLIVFWICRFSLYYRVVVFKAPLQGLCYTVRDAVDWCDSPTTRWFLKGSNHSPLQFC